MRPDDRTKKPGRDHKKRAGKPGNSTLFRYLITLQELAEIHPTNTKHFFISPNYKNTPIW